MQAAAAGSTTGVGEYDRCLRRRKRQHVSTHGLEAVPPSGHIAVVDGESDPIRVDVDSDHGCQGRQRHGVASKSTSEIQNEPGARLGEPFCPMEGHPMRRRLFQARPIEQHPPRVGELVASLETQQGGLCDCGRQLRVEA